MVNKGTVLVTGATGNTGAGLVKTLLESEFNVRAFVRDQEKAQPLKALGAEIVLGDLDRPETISPAITGVDKIYLLTWNGSTQAQQAKNVINAAIKSGNKPYIVRHSMWGPSNSRIIKQGNEVEEALKASGLPWTILKPTFFMQNLMMAAQSIASDGQFYWDTGDGKLAMIDVRDIVDSAFAVLTGSGYEGQSYILTGPQAISMYDVANTFSNELGRKVTYSDVPHEAAFQSMTSMGVPEWIARGYGELMEGFSKGFANRPTENVATLTGHPARSIEQFVHDNIQFFEPHPTTVSTN